MKIFSAPATSNIPRAKTVATLGLPRFSEKDPFTTSIQKPANQTTFKSYALAGLEEIKNKKFIILGSTATVGALSIFNPVMLLGLPLMLVSTSGVAFAAGIIKAVKEKEPS